MKQLFCLLLLLLPSSLMAQQREVLLETTEGNIRIRLFDDTPIHSNNFVKLVEDHFLDSLLFHRVIKNFMIQSGDPTSRHAQPGVMLGTGDNGYTLKPEFMTPVHYHRRGAVAMAREGDRVNPGRFSSGCQFYIVWGKTYSTKELQAIQRSVEKATDGRATMTTEMFWTYRKTGGAPHLDGQYTVFGEVVEGLNVVEKIQKAYTDDYDRPVDDIRILRATLLH